MKNNQNMTQEHTSSVGTYTNRYGFFSLKKTTTGAKTQTPQLTK